MPLFIVALVFAGVPQTNTQCVRNGVVTNCTTTDSQPSWTDLLQKPRASEPYIPPQQDDGPSPQSRVADLIARGDCPGALRLAHFYNKRRLIASTEKACR